MLSKDRGELYKRLENFVGNTPLYEIKRIKIPNRNRIFAKEEWKNPIGSLFDRVYPFLFRLAEEEGKIVPGVTPVIEATTGNAGASFAWCAKNLGYDDRTVIIHEDAPRARIEQIRSYGAKVIFSPAGQYAKGTIRKLEELLAINKAEKGGRIGENARRLFCVTKINPRAREVYEKLIKEVKDEIGGMNIDFFIGVVGSGTSISGIGHYLKSLEPHAQVIAVDPVESPSTYLFKKEGKTIGLDRMPHEIFGASTFGVPLEKLNLDLNVIDEVKLVRKEEYENACDLLEKLEQKSVGRTSGCSLAVALKIAEQEHDKNFLICFYDPSWKYGENYLRSK